MKKIKLTQGKYALVDNEDFEKVNSIKWCFNNGYAINKRIAPMHRFIMNCPAEMIVDHINGDRLDNRKSNLRICNNQQNSVNKEFPYVNSTGYRGIHARGKRYYAKFANINLGTFDTIREAIKAYNKHAKIRFGKFARLHKLP